RRRDPQRDACRRHAGPAHVGREVRRRDEDELLGPARQWKIAAITMPTIGVVIHAICSGNWNEWSITRFASVVVPVVSASAAAAAMTIRWRPAPRSRFRKRVWCRSERSSSALGDTRLA